MGRRIGPAKIKKYSLAVKLKARTPELAARGGVLIKDVPDSVCIYPFMLSRWRKQVFGCSPCTMHSRSGWNSGGHPEQLSAA